MLEARIQSDIVLYLQDKKIFCHSVPNEAAGNNAVRTMQLIAMGLRPGAADLLVWWPLADGVRLGYVEVKNEKGTQSASQRKFQARCELSRIPYVVLRSVDELKQYMESIGVTR